MLEEFAHAYSSAMAVRRERKERETNALIAEIEAFHLQNAIDKSLATNNKEAFLQLTGGIDNAN